MKILNENKQRAKLAEILGKDVEGHTKYLQGIDLPIMVNTIWDDDRNEWSPSEVCEMHVGIHNGERVLLITPGRISVPYD